MASVCDLLEGRVGVLLIPLLGGWRPKKGRVSAGSEMEASALLCVLSLSFYCTLDKLVLYTFVSSRIAPLHFFMVK